jgi:hypothetical protein
LSSRRNSIDRGLDKISAEEPSILNKNEQKKLKSIMKNSLKVKKDKKRAYMIEKQWKSRAAEFESGLATTTGFRNTIQPIFEKESQESFKLVETADGYKLEKKVDPNKKYQLEQLQLFEALRNKVDQEDPDLTKVVELARVFETQNVIKELNKLRMGGVMNAENSQQGTSRTLKNGTQTSFFSKGASSKGSKLSGKRNRKFRRKKKPQSEVQVFSLKELNVDYLKAIENRKVNFFEKDMNQFEAEMAHKSHHKFYFDFGQ